MANRFWVAAGNGTWDNATTSNWSTTTGGGSGASVPGSSDTAIFDNNSGSGTITTNYAASIAGLTLNTGYAGTVTFGATNTFTTSGAITLTQGTLNTNGQTVSTVTFVSTGSLTRTLTMGGSAITLTSGGTAWNSNGATNMTISSNTATITFTGASVNFNTASGQNMNGTSIIMNGSGAATVGFSCTVANFTRTGTAVTTDSFISGGTVFTVTVMCTLAGSSVTNRLFVNSGALGTSKQITAAAISLSNVDFMDITGAGLAANAAWTPVGGTTLGDALGNSNITFAAPTTRYAVVAGNWSNTATWSATDGGTGGVSVPLPQDTVILNGNSAAGTYVIDMPRTGADINFTGFTRTINFSVNSTCYGSLTLSSTLSNINGANIAFGGRSAKTLTAATRTPPSIGINMPGGTLTLQDNITVGGNLTLTQGTLDAAANNVNVTANTFSSTGSIRRDIKMGSGTWTFTSTGTVLQVSNWGTGGGVWNSGTSTIVISDVSSTSKTIVPGGSTVTYNNFSITGGGTGAILWNNGASQTFQCSGTFTIGAPKTVTFVNGFTYTIGSFTALGSLGNVITINSDSPGVAANLSQANGINSCDYLFITDSHAGGGAAWYAGANSTDNGGNNTGWVFTAPPATRIYSTEMMMGI